MENQTWKVGEVAKRTGLTIRTLHHYDRIGLLSPAAHTESGHRLYTGEDLIRLHQALSLKELGFSLEEIKDMTSQTELPWIEMVKLQIQRLEERIAGMTRVRDRLRDIAETMETASTQPPVSSDAVLKAIQLSRMMNSPHFLPGQAEEMKTRLKTAAPVRQKQEREEEKDLVGLFRRYQQSGRLPHDPEVATAAREWKAVIDSHGMGDKTFLRSVESYYREAPDAALVFGMDKELYAYIREAVACLNE